MTERLRPSSGTRPNGRIAAFPASVAARAVVRPGPCGDGGPFAGTRPNPMASDHISTCAGASAE